MNMKSGCLQIAIAVSLVLVGCMARDPETEEVDGSLTCDDKYVYAMDWSAPFRASVESQVRSGDLVVVQYADCRITPLRDCHVPSAGYQYQGVTMKIEEFKMSNLAELYAYAPLIAISLESGYRRSVDMSGWAAVVGDYRSGRALYARQDLQGRCDQATHVVANAQIGAFKLSSDSKFHGRLGVDAPVASTGIRGDRRRVRERHDGNPKSCEGASPADVAPPHQCGALVRLELAPISRHAPACPPGTFARFGECIAFPTEGDVCYHIIQIGAHDSGELISESQKQNLIEECETLLRRRKDVSNPFVYQGLLGCLSNARTHTEVTACMEMWPPESVASSDG